MPGLARFSPMGKIVSFPPAACVASMIARRLSGWKQSSTVIAMRLRSVSARRRTGRYSNASPSGSGSGIGVAAGAGKSGIAPSPASGSVSGMMKSSWRARPPPPCPGMSATTATVSAAKAAKAETRSATVRRYRRTAALRPAADRPLAPRFPRRFLLFFICDPSMI